MSGTRSRLDDRAMPTPGNPRITVELEPGADPIRGLIERPDGRRQTFWGWLELLEELRRVASGKARDDAGRPAGPAPHKRKEDNR